MTLALFVLGLLCQTLASAALGGPALPTRPVRAPQQVAPVLFFPEQGMDDTAAYQGYATRLYRDSKSNTVQIYIDRKAGREVLLWADALDESAAFTVRDARGRASALDWDADSAAVSDSADSRTIAYRLRAPSSSVTLGWFLLGTMRVERDFQYSHGHLKPFTAAPYVVTSESLLVANVQRLPSAERTDALTQLGAQSAAELRSRLVPTITVRRADSAWIARVEKPALDGKSRIAMEISGNTRESSARMVGRTLSVRSRAGGAVRLGVRVTTNGTALTPLARREIFTPEFLSFLDRSPAANAANEHRRLEREVRSVELLSSNEKLMAGLPNYATYFGRDGMMTALMMRPIWMPRMSERVIASVLGKLGPAGDVSHEEALGEQAIREHADEYNALIASYLAAARRGARARADSDLAASRDVLRGIRRTRENYHMMDDEFQLPVLEALYFADSGVSAEQKRAFLRDTSANGERHLVLMLREMALVSKETQPFVENPVATNLVSFVKHDSTNWQSASWRDSDVGYANGRFAMDLNAIWAPRALQSIASALASLRALGITTDSLATITPEIARSPLGGWLRDSASLGRAIERWQRARKLFTVALGPREIQQHVRAKLASLPVGERRYWETTMSKQRMGDDSLIFLALSLDARGAPIPVVNTDPATDLFLRGVAAGGDSARTAPAEVLQEVAPFVRDYPVALFVDTLGPVVANDTYARPDVWKMFEREAYHSPRVVWGREVSLFLLGTANQISASVRDPSKQSYLRSLQTSLERVRAAVSESRLGHNEVWSYRISDGRLLPTRYGTSSDVQLWSTADLAVQFALSRLPRH